MVLIFVVSSCVIKKFDFNCRANWSKNVTKYKIFKNKIEGLVILFRALKTTHRNYMLKVFGNYCLYKNNFPNKSR